MISMEPGYLPLIVAAAAITYGTRIAGLAFGDRAVPTPVRRFLAYVPVAAFAALAAPGIGGTDHELIPRLAAVTIASVVVLRIGRLWACLTIGMGVYWLTRWAL